jgi:hypothetical protein
MSRWLYTVDIKQFLGVSTDKESVKTAAMNIAAIIRTKLPEDWHNEAMYEGENFDSELDDILYSLDSDAQSGDCNDLNSTLNQLYDWADYKRVWLGL